MRDFIAVMIKTVALFMSLLFISLATHGQSRPGLLQKFDVSRWNQGSATQLQTVRLQHIDHGTTAYGGYRWRDVAGNLYSDAYRNSFAYDQPGLEVKVIFAFEDSLFSGILKARNLKPNFAYQFKLVGYPGTTANETIGLTGRWWQETWTGLEWGNGTNLNEKGDGSSPNPNDLLYYQRKDVPDPTSPTGKMYRFTGYLLFDYFITDEEGSATVPFASNSSFHVLWNTIQRNRTADDGIPKTVTFDPEPSQTAYDIDYPESTMTVFGEWERLPAGGVYLPSGLYQCQILLTEESFHGWPGGDYTGGWAAAMGTEIMIRIM